MEMKNINGPRIEEAQIPNRMARLAPSLGPQARVLTQGEDVVNHFAIELARGGLAIPPYIPLVTGDLVESRRMPEEPILRAPTTRGQSSNRPTKGRRPNQFPYRHSS